MRAKGLRAREKRREDDEAAEGNLGSAQRKGHEQGVQRGAPTRTTSQQGSGSREPASAMKGLTAGTAEVKERQRGIKGEPPPKHHHVAGRQRLEDGEKTGHGPI